MVRPKSPLHHRRWTLRLFEWGILVSVLLTLMGLFLNRVRYLQAEAERQSVQTTVENLRAAVVLAGLLPAASGPGHGARWQDGNPITLLRGRVGLVPDGYLGELEMADPGLLAPGSWYFDKSRRALIYLVRNAAGFSSPLPGPARIRLCMRAGEGDSKAPLSLELCEPYGWSAPK